jgi:PAS domain S-box-containing protein
VDSLILVDYIINLSVFSLLVSVPLIIRSFVNHKPFKYHHLLAGLYAGLVSIIVVMMTIHEQGYAYDIRYAPIILIFAYLGPAAGMLTATISIISRLLSDGHWLPAFTGWAVIMISFLIASPFLSRLSALKKCAVFYGIYGVVYVVMVPFVFNIFRNQPLFHFQYMLFVMLGVIIGALIIESYMKLFRLNNRLSEMYKMVEESEAKYRLIAEKTSDLIMLMDNQFGIRYLSPSHQMVLGYHEGEMERLPICQFIHPDDLSIFKTSITAMIEHHQCNTMEFRLRHHNGKWIEFESRCMPVKGENHEIENIVIISRDISERKKAEELLLQSEKLSIVGELAAGVAHEIRNPLTTIKGFIQLYKSEYNDLLLSELERIEGITSELLTLGKPQAVQLERTNMKDLMEYTIDLLSPQALLKNIQFNWTHDDFHFFMTCEKNQLKQVFLNILKNAMEAMKDGGTIHIHLGKGATDSECLLSVQDEGCGIPEELLPRLGEPFYSLKEKGTGLGLMMCHKIIKQHNGTITYKSKVNEGTRIEIVLPLAG